MTTYKTRFAPSPTGYLHLGHAFSAIIASELAEKSSGNFYLRIEDIDLGRSKINYEETIYEDLEWLGLKYERQVRRQSEHFKTYEEYLKKLRDYDLIYPCWATRSEIKKIILSGGGKASSWPLDPDGQYIYPEIYKGISASRKSGLMLSGKDFSWRIDIKKAISFAESKIKSKISFDEIGLEPKGIRPAEPKLYGDLIIARKDIPTSYHLSVTVDDSIQNINLVTRGLDLYPSTSIHRLLQIILDLPEPKWFHHNLLRDKNDQKLSKSTNSTSLRSFRNKGTTREEISKLIKEIEPFPLNEVYATKQT